MYLRIFPLKVGQWARVARAIEPLSVYVFLFAWPLKLPQQPVGVAGKEPGALRLVYPFQSLLV